MKIRHSIEGSMWALVARSGTFVLEQRPVPHPGPNDVVVRATAGSLCSADIVNAGGGFSFASETAATEEPFIVGHETIGVVHELGSQVSGFSLGERVVSMSTTPCGQCHNCQRGFHGHCGATMWGGYTAAVTRNGTLAEYFLVTDAKQNLAHIPDYVSDETAILVADSFASGSSGVEAAQVPLGGVVVVIGQGHVGLAATLTARLVGAGLVIAVKNRPGGEERSRSLGADVVLNNAEHDVVAEVLRLTNGKGADCVVEASGVRSSFTLGIRLTRLGGVTSVLSSYEDSRDTERNASLEIPLENWGWGLGDQRIISTFQRCGSERAERLMRLLENSRFDPNLFFTHRYEFGDVEQAVRDFTDAGTGVLKPFIRFENR